MRPVPMMAIDRAQELDEAEVPDEAEALRRVQEMLGAQVATDGADDVGSPGA